MDKQTYILTAVATRGITPQDAEKEYAAIMQVTTSKPKPDEVVSEHIAPALGIYERTLGNGEKQVSHDNGATWVDA